MILAQTAGRCSWSKIVSRPLARSGVSLAYRSHGKAEGQSGDAIMTWTTGDRAGQDLASGGQTWLIRGASPLGGDRADILVEDGIIVDVGAGGSLPHRRGN